MKIIFLSGLYPLHTKGGGEISTYLIAEGLKARGHEVEVITEGNSHLGLLKKPLFERQRSRRVAAKLKKILPQADVIHAHDFRSALVLSELQTPSGISPLSGGDLSSLDKGRLGGVSVATIRDYAPVCGTTNNVLADGSRCHCTWHDAVRTKRFQEVGFPRNYARAWQYWHNIPYRNEAFRKLKQQIFISRAQQAEIAEQLDLTGISTQVIYNPVSEEYLNEPIQEGQKGSVLYVGRVEDYKGVRLLLEAWKEIVRDVSETHLIIIGEGAQQSEYEKWVRQNGVQARVTFKGRVPYERLRAVYDEAQIVVAPHIWTEPFGRTVAEAMARGKVVVAANSGGPAEMIQDTKNGLLFERNSVSALATVLHETLHTHPERQKEIGSAAQEWVARNLTVEKVSWQYEEFYEKMRAST